jgi:hypothetical protein
MSFKDVAVKKYVVRPSAEAAAHPPTPGIARPERLSLSLVAPLFPDEAKRLKLDRPGIRRAEWMATIAESQRAVRYRSGRIRSGTFSR